MKKFLLSITLLLTGVSLANAQQQVNNSDFEQWGGVGTSNERPTNWNNMMNGDLCFFCVAGKTQTTWQSTDIRPGSIGQYSVKIKSGSALGNVINGNMTLGKLHAPSTTPSDGYNQSTRSDANFSENFTGKPDSLVFWAKYSITDNQDSARVSFTIHDDFDYQDPEGTSGSSSHWVAKATKNFQTGNQWVRISIPFSYAGAPSTTPLYILGTFASSWSPGIGVNGATLYVDDAQMIYNDNKNQIAPVADQTITTNQNGTQLTDTDTPNAGSTVTGHQWKSATTAGGPYTDITGETGATYTPNFATAGTYYVVCVTTFNNNGTTETKTSNEVKITVNAAVVNSVAITPTADQNLIETQAGNALTANEAPSAADSHEWKYTTTSGSGYTSFAPAQTGATYTPQFATAGTYYVVCVSNFGGEIKISNEVKVVVSEFSNSIAPTAEQDIAENVAGTELTVTESPVASSREWKYSTTSGSGYTSFAPAQTGTTYTPQFATAGTYYVVATSTIDGITVTSNEVKVVVSEAQANLTVSIAPTADQALEVNEAGNELTATVSTTPDSQEWKYTTTSGSGYTSFATAQTGTTYTPQFATAGTYYVVCQATLGGNTVTSNEVKITVEDHTGVNNTTLPDFKVYANGHQLNIDFTQVNVNGKAEIIGMDGKLIEKTDLTPNQMNTLKLNVQSGIYMYRIYNGKNLFTGKFLIE